MACQSVTSCSNLPPNGSTILWSCIDEVYEDCLSEIGRTVHGKNHGKWKRGRPIGMWIDDVRTDCLCLVREWPLCMDEQRKRDTQDTRMKALLMRSEDAPRNSKKTLSSFKSSLTANLYGRQVRFTFTPDSFHGRIISLGATHHDVTVVV